MNSEPREGDTFLSPGVLTSISRRPGRFSAGAGVDVSFYRFGYNGSVGGAFAQWEAMELDHHRFAAGVQGGIFIFGVEFGAVYETADAEHTRTISLHAAPYLSAGVVVAGLRLDIPVLKGGDGRPSHGFDLGFTLALKIPIELEVK
jgi:hypothetical protein